MASLLKLLWEASELMETPGFLERDIFDALVKNPVTGRTIRPTLIADLEKWGFIGEESKWDGRSLALLHLPKRHVFGTPPERHCGTGKPPNISRVSLGSERSPPSDSSSKEGQRDAGKGGEIARRLARVEERMEEMVSLLKNGSKTITDPQPPSEADAVDDVARIALFVDLPNILDWPYCVDGRINWSALMGVLLHKAALLNGGVPPLLLRDAARVYGFLPGRCQSERDWAVAQRMREAGFTPCMRDRKREEGDIDTLLSLDITSEHVLPIKDLGKHLILMLVSGDKDFITVGDGQDMALPRLKQNLRQNGVRLTFVSVGWERKLSATIKQFADEVVTMEEIIHVIDYKGAHKFEDARRQGDPWSKEMRASLDSASHRFSSRS